MEISIVIPIYNVTKNAVEHIPSIIDLFRCKYIDFELLFVIDNIAIDREVQALLNLSNDYPEVKICFLNKNYGQHFATLCGYFLAKGDFIVCIDEDMTKYIPEICNYNEYKNFEVFYFHYNKSDMYRSNIRRFFSNAYKNIINKVVNLKEHSTYRIISKSLRDKILLEKHIFWNLDVMIFDNTKKIGSTTLFLPDINDKDSVYNYKKLSVIAFEIAYEHNNILSNIIFAILPTLIFYSIFSNLLAATLFYFILAMITCFYFVLGKRKTKNTQQKILDAFTN